MVTCPTCGFQNSADAKSCESCGTFLKRTASRQSAESSERPFSIVNEQAHAQNPGATTQIPDPGSMSSSRNRSGKSRIKKSMASHQNPDGKQFHLQSYQLISIAAALLLGGILVYGLMSSKPVATQQNDSGGAAQQQSSGGEPNADVLHEIDRLRQVVDKNPSDLVSTLRLSNMLQDNSMYDQAAIYYNRYLDKVPDNVDARVDYGVTLYEGGHTQEAMAQLNQAIKMDPKHQKAYFNLGIVYLNAGEIDKSNDALKKCVQLDPQSDVGKQAEQIMEQHANIKN